MSYSTIIARAKRYGDSKKGPYLLRFFEGPPGIKVQIEDGDLIEERRVSKGEMDQLKPDEQVARLCEVIHEAISAMRLLGNVKAARS